MLRGRGFTTLSLVALALSGCRTRTDNAGLKTAIQNQYDANLLVQCSTPQGNGGNWAATLGWIAEDWMVLSERASFVATQTGRPTYVFMRCMSGGSSGSGATNVTMNLLKNTQVLKEAPKNLSLWNRGFFTPEEVHDYARAMRFLANSVDMNVAENAYFFLTMFEEMIAAQLQGANGGEGLQELAQKQKDSVLGKIAFQRVNNLSSKESNGANWWKGSVASAGGAVADFGKLAHAATALSRAHLDKPIEDILSFNALKTHFTKNGRLRSVAESFWESLAFGISGFFSLLSSDVKDLTFDQSLTRAVQFAKDHSIVNASDFAKFKNTTDLGCSTASPSCNIAKASLRISLQDFKEATLQKGDKTGLTPELRYAYHYIIESAQTFYAGYVVDRLSKNESLTENKTSKEVNAAKVFETTLNQVVSKGPQAARDSELPLLETLAQPMEPGYFTITTAALAENSGIFSGSKKPHYQDLRMVIFGSGQTMQAIQNSKLYQDHTEKCATSKGLIFSAGAQAPTDPSPFTCRFVLATVDRAVYSMLPSVREPGLMNELYAPAQAKDPNSAGLGHMGITALYDPQEMRETSAITPANGQSTWFAVGGGWPDRRVGNWMMMYYMDSLLDTESSISLEKAYEEVTGTGGRLAITAAMSIFGKPDRTAHWKDAAANVDTDSTLKAKFDVKAVGEIFTSKEEEARTARNDYLTFMAAYYQFFGFNVTGGPAAGQTRLLSDRNRNIPFQLRENMLHWDMRENRSLFQKVSNLPSFIILSESGGASRFLNKLAHNGVREALKETHRIFPENGDASSEEQICSLAKIETNEKTKTQNISRIYCTRALADKWSVSREAELFGPNVGYRQQLADLASRPGYTFSVMDPRITLSRTDADAVVESHENISKRAASL